MADVFGLKSSYSSVMQSVGVDDGYKKVNFICNRKVNYIANDSPDNSLIVSLDAPCGSSRDMILLPGETLSDMEIACKDIYARALQGTVTYRAVGY